MNAMSDKEQSKVWFITGVSRGFGRELASAALEQGDVVIGTSRMPRPAGKTRESVDERDGRQPGDPALAAGAVLEVTRARNPPLRLILGADAVERVRAKLAQVADDLKAW
jgi:NAD(P)-dependent dehydrogenase (short-subunit alcohol dehydrogenase family)